ncbi:MAG TPA: hypothetical protein VJI52_00605 [Candidatus Nanoarchaeia archaeon]|nr:hypothetical protein [Candidatus Nanoarchaeia archaeon]
MIKKTRVKKEGFPSMLSSFFGGLFSSIKDRVTQGADAVLDHIEERIVSLQKKLLRNLFIMLCISAGIAALLLSLCFYLVDVLHWQRYVIFLVLGALLLIIASVRANLKN